MALIIGMRAGNMNADHENGLKIYSPFKVMNENLQRS
jgi:hypothetical protein